MHLGKRRRGYGSRLFPVQTADLGATLGSRANMASFHTVWTQMKAHGLAGLVMNVRGVPEWPLALERCLTERQPWKSGKGRSPFPQRKR